MFGLFAGWYYWFEKMFGIKYNGFIGGLHFWLMFIGSNVLFFPQHFLGLNGMPRRYIDYNEAFSQWHYWSSVGYAITLVATLIFFFGMIEAVLRRRKARRQSLGRRRNDARMDRLLAAALPHLQRFAAYVGQGSSLSVSWRRFFANAEPVPERSGRSGPECARPF